MTDESKDTRIECPFCGSLDLTTSCNAAVVCRDCHACGPITSTDDEAIAAWNRWFAPQPPDEPQDECVRCKCTVWPNNRPVLCIDCAPFYDESEPANPNCPQCRMEAEDGESIGLRHHECANDVQPAKDEEMKRS